MQFNIANVITVFASFGAVVNGMAVDVEKLAVRTEEAPAANMTTQCNKLGANLGDWVHLKGSKGSCSSGHVTASMPDTVGVDVCCGPPQRFWNRCDIEFVFGGC